ncbi:MAG: HAD family hydrolase [Acidobacteria bacterium]|nr:HAD family hydrolase [Acidobacteriota bacterium]
MPAGSPAIRAVLFDADGVIQRGFSINAQPLRDSLNIPTDRLPACVADLFAAERNALTGTRSLEECVAHLPAQWGCRGTADDIIRSWTISLEADPGMVAGIRSLRALGIPCFLASNQGHSRARYMSEVVGYRNIFDREFYSCTVGLAKPGPEYFRLILR